MDAAREELATLTEACVRSRGADREAFERLHKRFDPGIRAFFAKRLPGRGVAGASPEMLDDLSQRVWTGLWEALDRGRYDPARASISTFLYAIAAKTWLRHIRRKGTDGPGTRSVEAWDDAEALEDSGDEPGSVVASAELLEAVRRCLRGGEAEEGPGGGLTDQERAIVMAAAEGASDRELAKRFDLAASTVNAKKRAGWEKIRRYLARLGHRVENAERSGQGEE